MSAPAPLVPVPVPAAELECGARLRDRGRLRRVQCVEPAVVSDSLRIFFEDDGDPIDSLRMDVGQMVMVDPMLSMTVIGGLDVVLVLVGVVALIGPRKELRFAPCGCARPECAGLRREWVALS